MKQVASKIYPISEEAIYREELAHFRARRLTGENYALSYVIK